VQIQLQVGDKVTILPLSRYPSADWRVGEPVHEKYDLVIPPDLPAGPVNVTLKPISGTDTAVSLGQIEIIATDRQFQLPNDLDTTLALQFGSDIYLRGMKGPTVQGDTLSITLYWQTEQPPASLYTAFVHVLDADGRTIVQADQWPGGLPSNTWAPSEVIADNYTISLPADAAPGQLAIGLYTADNGLRLLLTDPAGNTYPDDRLLVPLSP
jgi:hypothetical protein